MFLCAWPNASSALTLGTWVIKSQLAGHEDKSRMGDARDLLLMLLEKKNGFLASQFNMTAAHDPKPGE